MLVSYYILNNQEKVCAEAKRKELKTDILEEHFLQTAERPYNWEWSNMTAAAIIRTDNFTTVLTLHGVSYEKDIFNDNIYLYAK